MAQGDSLMVHKHIIPEYRAPQILTALLFDYPTVYFQRNSIDLDKKIPTSLTPLVEHLKSHPDLQIRLIGRVDEQHTQPMDSPYLADERTQ